MKKIKLAITSQSNQKTDTNKIQRNKTYITTKPKKVLNRRPEAPKLLEENPGRHLRIQALPRLSGKDFNSTGNSYKN